MIHALFLLLLVPSILCSAGCTDRGQRSGEQASAQAAPASPVSLRFDSAALSARITAIETAIEGSRRKLNVPGASVAIVLDDRPILLSGFGVRDLRSGAPVTPKTLFSIGSCTKPFTALATLIAAEEGRLSLDGSPKKLLPYFVLRDPAADRAVTIRDLLSHRTGVPDDLPAGWFERYPTHEALIRAAVRSQPTAPIRTRFQYNK